MREDREGERKAEGRERKQGGRRMRRK